MELQDRILTCVDCSTEFVWTAGEQLFFADKNFKNEPKRCKACKAKRATRAASPGVRERVETQATCSACGKDTTVPFRPTQGRPVFCKECFQQRKFAGAGGEDSPRLHVRDQRSSAERPDATSGLSICNVRSSSRKIEHEACVNAYRRASRG